MIAGHFGRCGFFVIFEASPAGVVEVERRANANSHHHVHGDCGGRDHEGAADGHQSFLAALHDCTVVICRGMGRRAVADLAARGIAPAIVSEDLTARQAAEMYATGALKFAGDSSCCSH
jgi:predicted Fe-Mo cluster-binding NifX family protein